MLNADQYGVREYPLRGAPMSLEDWRKRHDGHDVMQSATGPVPRHICFTCWTEAVERVKDAPAAEEPTKPTKNSTTRKDT